MTGTPKDSIGGGGKVGWPALLALASIVAVGAAAWVVSQGVARRQEQLDERLGRQQNLEARLAEARAEEDRRRAAIEQAERDRRQALENAEQDRSGAEAAAEQKLRADEARAAAAEAAQQAMRQAAEAKRRAAEERKKREEEWTRLARALGKVAPTERSGWTIITVFPPNLERERLSRLAGILLANQGYQAVLEDAGDPARAEQIKKYLIAAGAPPEVLHRAAGKGDRMRLLVSDTILNEPQPPPAEPALPDPPSAKSGRTAATPLQEGYQIQVAAFQDPSDAKRLAKTLRTNGHPVEVDSESRQGWVRVLVGPFADRTAAERAERKLRDAGRETWLQRR